MTLPTEPPRATTGGLLGGEILRAFLVFAALFVALTGMAEHLAARELDLKAIVRRLTLGQDEAERIADAVAALAWGRDGIDFEQLRRRRSDLAQLVDERLWARSFVQYVEIRDRYGAPLLFLTRAGEGAGSGFGTPPPGSAGALDVPQVVSASLQGPAGPEGEVRLGISGDAFQREILALQRSLRVKVLIAAFFGLSVLGVGFLYVLHLIRKIRRLEEAKMRAERRATMGFLARGLAHEIRNPLNAMNMNLQMLEEELSGVPQLAGSDWAEMLQDTKREVKRLGDLVTSFLDYARGTPVQLEKRDLNAEMRDVARLFQADFATHGLELVLELEPELPPWDVDDRQLRQAVINLLVNARQVLRNGGRVVLRTRLGPGGEAVLEVEDDGPGIPQETRARIFEPFFTTKGGGTGLGLPIAQQIVERHGGRLEVESTLERGSTFRIRLPRRTARGALPAPSPQVAS
jgi:two-component system sensor histidine kinase HydH